MSRPHHRYSSLVALCLDRNSAPTVMNVAEKFTASTRAESTREKGHIGEDPVSEAPPGTENGPPPDRPKSDFFAPEQTDSRPVGSTVENL